MPLAYPDTDREEVLDSLPSPDSEDGEHWRVMLLWLGKQVIDEERLDDFERTMIMTRRQRRHVLDEYFAPFDYQPSPAEAEAALAKLRQLTKVSKKRVEAATAVMEPCVGKRGPPME